ncbi:MAG: peptidoglycan DD-metalloendopeptidase family protein [bacterium]|nr:peptidoglycan DD-metalloendopeptidase family protein [bacterium]
MSFTRLFFISLLLFSFPSGIYAVELESTNERLIRERKKLENVQKKIKEEKREIKKASTKERDLLEELAVIDALLQKKRSEVLEAERELAGLKKRIETVEKRIQELEKEKKERRKGLKKRVAALYKLGNIGPVNLLFSSRSLLDLEKRYIFVQSVIEKDAYAIEKYLGAIDELNDSYLAIDAKKNEAKAVSLKLAAQKEKTQRELDKKKKLIASIASSKELHEKKLAQLKASSVRLESLLVKLEASLSDPGYTSYGGGGLSALKGRLDLPCNGEVTAFFGKSKDINFNTDIIRKGIDIAAPWGSEVAAIHGGKVAYAGSFKGYGNIVIIDHGEGYYSLSANLSKILKKKGEEVNAGSVIALSGDTGSLTGPRLYFEIRYKGKPVDPLDWVKSPSKIAKKRSSGRNR